MNWTVNAEQEEHSNMADKVQEATNLENNGSLYTSSSHIKENHSMHHEKKSISVKWPCERVSYNDICDKFIENIKVGLGGIPVRDEINPRR